MKVEVSVECLPRVGPDRKENWYVVAVFGPDESAGEVPWKKKFAEATREELSTVLAYVAFRKSAA